MLSKHNNGKRERKFTMINLIKNLSSLHFMSISAGILGITFSLYYNTPVAIFFDVLSIFTAILAVLGERNKSYQDKHYIDNILWDIR